MIHFGNMAGFDLGVGCSVGVPLGHGMFSACTRDTSRADF
jgi:hypothetical protein